ncbi:MAG TPA: hypothetical protein VFM39_03975 [bacterium]|nr:hypothetical protein [bacterium]
MSHRSGSPRIRRPKPQRARSKPRPRLWLFGLAAALLGLVAFVGLRAAGDGEQAIGQSPTTEPRSPNLRPVLVMYKPPT